MLGIELPTAMNKLVGCNGPPQQFPLLHAETDVLNRLRTVWRPPVLSRWNRGGIASKPFQNRDSSVVATRLCVPRHGHSRLPDQERR
jgi:hypothetical protein